MYIEKPVLGKITQGTIFTAAAAENYPSAPVWGLCITARCDMEHENKIRVFNYIPVVRYEDWLLEDGARLLIDRIGSDVLGSAKAFLTQNKKSDSVLDSYTPSQVAKMLFPEGGRFHEMAEKLEIIASAKKSATIPSKTLFSLIGMNKKLAGKLIKELWLNQLQGFYYINDVGETDHQSNSGYVMLLREIHHIPRVIADEISRGCVLGEPSFKKNINQYLSCSAFDFSCAIGVLKSPWIEHLMQQFSIMFSRIGLPDPTPASLKILNGAIENVD